MLKFKNIKNWKLNLAKIKHSWSPWMGEIYAILHSINESWICLILAKYCPNFPVIYEAIFNTTDVKNILKIPLGQNPLYGNVSVKEDGFQLPCHMLP